MYLDREPNDVDLDNLSTITAEICADFPSFINCEESCKRYGGGNFNEIYFSDFKNVESFVAYKRKL